MYEDVDLRNPIANVPANAGLRFWWLGLPGVSGGKTAFDLSPWRHRGALTGFGAPTASSGWVPTGRGDLGVAFDGTDDYVLLPPAVNGVLNGGSWTAAMTVRVRSGPTTVAVLLGWKDDSAAAQIAYNWGGVGLLSVGREGYFYVINYTVDLVGKDTRVVWAYSGGSHRLYLDGVEVATGTGTLSTTYTGSYGLSSPNLGAGGGPFYGSISDFQLFARALTPAEVAADYAESRQGYPTRLNRVSDWRYAEQFSGGVGLVGPGLVGCNPLVSYGGLCW